MDVVENLARDRAKALFGADHANVQPHSGASANYAVYQALCNVGDTVMGMNLDNGGHLTHGSPVNYSGINYNIVPYGVDPKTHRIDYDKVRDIAKECKPKMIIAGASAYPRIIDFKAFREIADEVGAYLFVDMAHIAGLVAAGLHPSPVPYADVVTTTTHKTLRGPRGGIILCKEEHAKKIDKAIFPGSQGGPLMHIITAKAIALGEAMKPEFKTYQEQILKNAKVLAQSLMDSGFDLVSGGTDNHLMLVDLRAADITGKEMDRVVGEMHEGSRTLSGAYEQFTKQTQENLARTTALFDESISSSIHQLNETLDSMREMTRSMPQLLSQSRDRYAEQVDQFVTALVRLQKAMEKLSQTAEGKE